MSSFKRDNDLVKKASAIADNVSAEDASIINELIRKYNSVTYAEHTGRHKFYADMEKIYEVSVPMFVLPFVKVKASDEEDAKKKALEEIKYRLDILFPKNDNRTMNDMGTEDTDFKVTGTHRIEVIDGVKFYLDDYVDCLGNFDMIDDVKYLGVDEEILFNLPIVFTDGCAYCNIPNVGRAVWKCDTDEEWRKTRKPSDFDLYDDIENCGVNRWMIWYTTQKSLTDEYFSIVK